jgi:hypothetical protein
MAWERRGKLRYFYRTVWAGGRAEKRYFGRGPAGELAEYLDGQDRGRRKAQAESIRAEADRLEAPEAATRALNASCGLLTAAALNSVGLFRHNYGPWRRRRRARPTS